MTAISPSSPDVLVLVMTWPLSNDATSVAEKPARSLR